MGPCLIVKEHTWGSDKLVILFCNLGAVCMDMYSWKFTKLYIYDPYTSIKGLI